MLLACGAAVVMTSFLAPRTSTVAQEAPKEIHGVIEGQAVRKVPIAIGPMTGGAGLSALGAEMRATLIDDLAYAGSFAVLGDDAIRGLAPPDPGAPDLAPWRAAGADAVVALNLSGTGDQITLEGRLFDAASAQLVLGKRYAGGQEIARRIAHRLANDIIEHFTGRPGVALTRIAFVSRSGAGKELYVMDYDGQRVRRMTTTGAINLSPTWSPDGSRLAFLSFRQKFPAIFILEADGTITRLPTAGGDLNSSPDWSPDGSRLVYSSSRDGNSELYVMDNIARGAAGAHRERRLTSDPGIDCAPTWSPRGTEIAFTSDRTGSPQIYIIDSDGGNLRRLTYEGKRNDSPAWSPRGDQIAYVSRTQGKFALMVIDLGTQKSRAILPPGDFNCEDPRWSPDARHLTFAADKEGSYDIYAVDLDGSNLRRLSRGAASFTPDWSR